MDAGEEWIHEQVSALLFVPSVIVPEERNILVNPAHPDSRKLNVTKVRRWQYDARLRTTSNL